MQSLTIHIENRDLLIRALREELVGPSPQGAEIDCSGNISFEKAEDFYQPWRQKGTGEEILQRDPPCGRYGVGVLYPVGMLPDDDNEFAGGIATEDTDGQEQGAGVHVSTAGTLSDEALKCIEEIGERPGTGSEGAEPDDFDLSEANKYKPSSMGVSFLARFPEGSSLAVDVPPFNADGVPVNGRYRKKVVNISGKERIWWLRSPVSIRAEFPAVAICSDGESVVKPTLYTSNNLDGMDIRIEVFSRPFGDANQRLLTVCLINRKKATLSKDEDCLFQSYFTATVKAPDGAGHILPYPGPPMEKMDGEEQSQALLYHRLETFATGHGCAANWDAREGEKTAKSVSAECLPVFETPSITPDITRNDGSPVEIPMASLAGLVDGDDGFAALKELVHLYEQWIKEKEKEIHLVLEAGYRDVAKVHMKECRRCLNRMKDGLDYLQSDQMAKKAFQLANYAVLLQQVRSRREPRWAQYDTKEQRIKFSAPYIPANDLSAGSGKGKWRAFQAAFLLASVRSTAENDVPERRIVDLIWFPTGGGKTEAYLGLAAFAILMRRLKNPQDAGVHVLMRYTLRLLTAQQFLRAAGLLCALEYLRRKNPELGKDEFSIGLWLGGDTTPNSRREAVTIYNGLLRGDRNTGNKFVLGRCPWCGAQMGPLKQKGRKARKAQPVPGYERSGDTVVFTCPDRECDFTGGLPVYVIDEDIYIKKPSLIIGTIDKFAMLAWRPEARAIFGLDQDGKRNSSPPGLILQDELHLISGPLGSMAGLYETVIEELCTDRRGEKAVVPKIVCSTATIRRYKEQVKALYAREDTALFPPPGLDAGDSFFARYARNPDGSLCRGRIYAGVHAPGLGSMQTVQVRTFTNLLQAPVHLPNAGRDPWWSLLIFFNSLRELGTTLSLFQSDIPDYLAVLRNRQGLKPGDLRRLYNIIELTGRLKEDEVPEAISALEISCTSTGKYPVDACLASNIIEVGIDIDRLSLMAVIGQPKTTSQYIQVTGRVGRSWRERPGLVVTLYSSSKPRDRSHFEKFRSYHEKLYAQVEPTSVTPFSPPVLDRALHAVMAAYVRQAGTANMAEKPFPYPEDVINYFKGLILPRVSIVDPDEAANFLKVFEKRAIEWKQWESTRWSGELKGSDIPQLRVAGAYVSREAARYSWPTQLSMRNVDAQCQAVVTRLYLSGEGESDA
jgi:hypothetical protein